jgi:5-methylcytosine-specific restriction endonuclease McrA
MSIKHKGRIAKKLAKRDGWRCWLCGEPIDRLLRAPDRHAKTLDHVVPQAKYGTDDIRNLRLAHARCNHERGTKDASPHPEWWNHRPVVIEKERKKARQALFRSIGGNRLMRRKRLYQ